MATLSFKKNYVASKIQSKDFGTSSKDNTPTLTIKESELKIDVIDVTKFLKLSGK